MYTADQICSMTNFLVGDIFVKFFFGGVSILSGYWNPYGNELCSIAR